MKDPSFRKYLIDSRKKRIKIGSFDPGDRSGIKREQGEEELVRLRKRLEVLQELLYAENKHRVLVVLQGIDTAGKDGTIRRVFEGVNPQGVRVARFGPPTPEESDHDFLWRVHKMVPRSGEIVIFNRSHYEGVLVERVHDLVPREMWEHRYQEINDFERMLVEEGTSVLKFYLHIDSDEQKKRLRERLDDPTKHWKFSADDISERHRWPQYMEAYEDMLRRTSTNTAPWYVVPSDHGWFRDLVVCSVLVMTLEGLHMRYPKLKAKLKII